MRSEKRIHQLFVVSVTLKGLHALIEIAGGIALYLFSTDAIVRWLYAEAGDSNDWIATFASTFTGQEHHYLRFLPRSATALVKCARRRPAARRSSGPIRRRSSCWPLFIAYQLYRYTYTHDIGLIVLQRPRPLRDRARVATNIGWLSGRTFPTH